ncbi:MAPEG family protein [Novosphingobium flavum]|uniref:MAPEG family protein n=1 Tax=Novosphingobium flavum TaxID=1778672 RepID=A0A7X1FQ91_9SPHN|nr:MAPEG family protein [Novosphingobium flavum]MBC2664970.1 MAPEG family protein [Novosphingobium flavum]
MLLQTTLCLAAAAAIINFWLGQRVGQLRHRHKVSIGTGGNDMIERRMRAQLNFAENVPLVLILIGLIEMTGKGGAWLAPIGAIFMFGRVLHGLGMDGGSLEKGRMIGTMTTFLIAIGLAVVAVLIAVGLM